MRRVAVTGLGAVTALGHGTRIFDRGLREGRSGIGELTLFDGRGFRTRVAAQVPDALPADDLGHAASSRPDRFGVEAASEAIAESGLDSSHLASAACVFGTGTGGAQLSENFLRATIAGEPADPALLVAHQPASVTDLVSRRFRVHGPRTTFMTACSSSATAIGYAGDLIRLGRVKVAIAGGAEGICRLTYAGFNALRASSTEPCRPFDARRSGLSLGEGAGALVLEDAAHAEARGAKILGYLAGWGISADAHHMTAPEPTGDGAARAMLAALTDAGLSADAIDYVNAHGTATPQNDAMECAALSRVLGARSAHVPVSSTKSMIGHTLGAAGAIEAIASLLALQGRYLPPTVNLETPDPALPFDFIPNHSRDAEVQTIMSNSFAFGGNNTVLIFERA